MTQAWPTQIADTSAESGDDLANRWNAFDLAIKSNQEGTSRPANIAAGGIWSRDNENGTFSLMIYDGAADRELQIYADRLQKPAFDFLASRDASGDATIEFTEFDASKYDAYQVILMNVIPATDDVNLTLRTSTDGGASFDDGASDYAWHNRGSAANANSSTGTTAISITNVGTTSQVGSGAGEYGISAKLMIYGPHLSAHTIVSWEGAYFNSGGNFMPINGQGSRLSAADVDAIQFLFASGNIESGTINLYGMRNA